MPLERIEQRDNMIGLRLGGVEKFKDLKFIRFLANFLRDEFVHRVRWAIHYVNMRWHLGWSVNEAYDE